MLNDAAYNMMRLIIQLQWHLEIRSSIAMGLTDEEILGEILVALENRSIEDIGGLLA